jgi:hypothetical protein
MMPKRGSDQHCDQIERPGKMKAAAAAIGG